MGGFSRLCGESFIVVVHCCDRVQRQRELIMPTKFKTSLAHGIIPSSGTRMSFGHVSCVSCEFIRYNTSFYVVAVGQPQVFFRRDITQHGCATHCYGSCANCGSNMVVTRSNVRDKRSKRIKRCIVALFSLMLIVNLNHIQRHMARSFHHDLHIIFPGAFSELTDSFKLCELCCIVSIGQTTWPEAIA